MLFSAMKQRAKSPVGKIRQAAAKAKAKQGARKILNGATLTQTLKDLGYAESVARHQPPHIVEPIRNELARALAQSGLGTEELAEKIAADADDENSTVRLGIYKLAVKVRGDEAPQRHQHEHSGEISISERRKQQRFMWEAISGGAP